MLFSGFICTFAMSLMIMLMLFFFLILVGLFTTSSVMANEVDHNAALKKAQTFMPGRQFTESTPVSSACSRGVDSGQSFYVFNAEDNRGFVIVSGDDRTRDILGYAEYGNLDTDHLPANVQWWLDSYASQISALSRLEPASPQTIGPAIEPLIQSKWNQDAPYYNMCPDGNYVDYYENGYDDFERCLTGCVPTSVAQVMYYWKWPETCPALDGYVNYVGKSLKALPSTTFNWADMTDTYSTVSSSEAADAVAELMRYCGQALHVTYGTGATSGYADPSILINTFGYSKQIRELKRDEYTISQWEAMVYKELSERRPLLYDGASEVIGAHMFIVDGYDGRGLFHINWGWSGLPDSYFVLSLCDPGSVQGADNSSGAYHYSQKALFNMQPGKDGEVMRPLLRSVGSHMYPPEMNNSYTRTNATSDFSDVYLCFDLYAYYPIKPESEMAVEVGWALYQADELKLLIGSAPTTIPAEKESKIHNEMTRSFGAGLPVGSYQLCQVFRLQGETDWERYEDYAVSSVNVDVTPTQLTMRVPDKYNMSFQVNSLRLSDYPEAGSQCSVSANITNNGDTQQLTSVLWIQKQGETDWTQCAKTTCYTELGKSADISLPFLQEEAGTYNLKLTTLNSDEALATATVKMAAYVDVVVDGLTYRCTPDYKLAKVIRDFSADIYVNSVNIQTTVKANGVDCKVVAIGNNAFYGWYLTSVTIPEGIETIGVNAFRYCSKLDKIVLPSTVTSIGAYAFYGTYNLSLLVSHIQNPFEIGNEMFMFQESEYTNNIMGFFPTNATLYVPIGSKSKYEALSGWRQFNVIEEGDLMESVVDGIRYAYATGGLTATVVQDDSYQQLTEITIPSSVVIDGKTLQVTAIGNSAFRECSNLKKISLPKGLEKIGDDAFLRAGFTEITLPGSLKTIGKEAFWNCIIKTLTVPEGVTTIGESAFAYMYNLVYLELPKSLTKIDRRLILGDNKLTSVATRSTDPSSISDLTFINSLDRDENGWVLTPSQATLYVPKGKLAAYQRLKGWNYFAVIKEMGEAGDSNNDGTVNKSDVVEIVNAVIGNPSSKFLRANADVNGDGRVDVVDIVQLISIIAK